VCGAKGFVDGGVRLDGYLRIQIEVLDLEVVAMEMQVDDRGCGWWWVQRELFRCARLRSKNGRTRLSFFRNDRAWDAA
jgi:hypothetical protein